MLAMCVFVGLYAQENDYLFSGRPDIMYRKCISVVGCFFVDCRIGKARWTLSEVRRWVSRKQHSCRITETECN